MFEKQESLCGLDERGFMSFLASAGSDLVARKM
jgi:hypothetical protein